jgi:hypothetical protein
VGLRGGADAQIFVVQGMLTHTLLFLVVLYYTSGREPDLFETCRSIL